MKWNNSGFVNSPNAGTSIVSNKFTDLLNSLTRSIDFFKSSAKAPLVYPVFTGRTNRGD
jgi:hypothetical protein